MSEHKPTDAKLRDLQRTERQRQRSTDGERMKRMPDTATIFKQIESNIEARGGEPRTFRCFVCQDTGFVLETKRSAVGYDALCGIPCAACHDPGFGTLEQADLEALRAIPWVIDGDLGKDRLRYRQQDEPTHWIYPDGKRCMYDGNHYRELPEIPKTLYQALLDEARRMRRVGTAELVKPWR